MDRTVILEAVSNMRELLSTAIDFSRWLPNRCDKRCCAYDDGADLHWATECEQHRQWHEQFDAALRRLEVQRYPVPDSWWLSEFVPQVAHVSCAEDNKTWILGTEPLTNNEPRTEDNVTPDGVILTAGELVEANCNEIVVIDGIVDESVVRNWEVVYREIAETERRLVELWGREQLTTDEARSKFCFEQWQAGRTLKEINVGLKSHPEWESFNDDRSLRGAIKSWSRRIGVSPRKGQPGRRAKA